MGTKVKWVIDPAHSEIAFKVKHLMITNVKGAFKQFYASVYTEGDDFKNAEVNFKMDAASVDTGNSDRDTHLKSPDFFDVENHKEITFVSREIENVDGGNFRIHGDLTIKGTAKPITVSVDFLGLAKDPWGNEKAGFELSTKINRKDWGLNWNVAIEAGGVLVSDDVYINCEVQLLRAKE